MMIVCHGDGLMSCMWCVTLALDWRLGGAWIPTNHKTLRDTAERTPKSQNR